MWGAIQTLQTGSPIRSVQVANAFRLVAVCQAEPVEARLNISTWKPGLYYIKIQTAEGAAVERVVKK